MEKIYAAVERRNLNDAHHRIDGALYNLENYEKYSKIKKLLEEARALAESEIKKLKSNAIVDFYSFEKEETLKKYGVGYKFLFSFVWKHMFGIYAPINIEISIYETLKKDCFLVHFGYRNGNTGGYTEKKETFFKDALIAFLKKHKMYETWEKALKKVAQ